MCFTIARTKCYNVTLIFIMVLDVLVVDILCFGLLIG